MASVTHLSRAPIVEAVIDVGLRFERAREATEFESYWEFVRNDYPNKQTRQNFAITVNANAAASERVVSELGGYVFRSGDGTRVVQSRPDGFSFSRLRPYGSWEATLDDAWRLWLLYRNHFRPDRISRLAVRYINRLDLPGPSLDFDEYLLTGPRVPQNVPQGLSAFSSSLVIPGVRPQVLAIVRQSFDGSGLAQDIVPVILDIDAILECDISVEDDAAVMDALLELRTVKNQIFFGSLTDKAVELFI